MERTRTKEKIQMIEAGKNVLVFRRETRKMSRSQVDMRCLQCLQAHPAGK